jgi:hypothetical protein
VAIPGDRNVTQKEAEKLSAGFMYRDKTNVEHEMYRAGEIRAGGLVTKDLEKSLETVPGKRSIDSLQKTAVLGASHVMWKVLQSET